MYGMKQTTNGNRRAFVSSVEFGLSWVVHGSVVAASPVNRIFLDFHLRLKLKVQK